MNRYIAMLRGINVGGHKKIKMVDLKAYIMEIGFDNVETYIQSGNIVFQSDLDVATTRDAIQNKIEEKYGWEVPTIIRTQTELKSVIERNPFSDEQLDRLCVTFLSGLPDQELVNSLREISYEPEEFIIEGRDIYFYSPLGFAKAKMSNNLFENKLKVNATTRNWKTVNKLLEMVSELP